MVATPKKETTSVLKAILKVQQIVGNIKKEGKNPHFKSEYITLEAIMREVVPILNEEGVVLVQETVTNEDGKHYERTTLINVDNPEDKYSVDYPISSKDLFNPQAVGSGVTYARRYSLIALFGIAGEKDDDGNRAATSPKATSAQGGTVETAADGAKRDRELLRSLLMGNGINTVDKFKTETRKRFKKEAMAELTDDEVSLWISELEKDTPVMV